jgi:hypothetical protein
MSVIRGIMPPATVDVDKSYENYENVRFTLRNAWNTKYTQTTKAVTPFRAVTNSGDILSRVAYSCGGPSQASQSRPGLFGIKGQIGSIKSKCDGSGIPPSTCNVKYVYDSSNYTTFLKQQATNKNYNDISNGGNNNSGNQVSFRAVRIY